MLRFLACALFCFAATVTAGETVFEVIPLKYRSSEEIILIVRPLLDKQGSVSGLQNRLIVRTTPANLQEIKRLLSQIDTLPRQLKITVRQDVDSTTAQRLRELSGSVAAGEVRATLPGSADNRGAVIESGRGDDRLRARVLDTRGSQDDKNAQYLQVLEGQRALIRLGKSVPVKSHYVRQTPRGPQHIELTDYRDVMTGFYVLPRINGERVTLEIFPQREVPGQLAGTVDTQQIVTTVSGKLGEWIDLGGVAEDTTSENEGIGSRATTTRSERRSVLLRVEEMK